MKRSRIPSELPQWTPYSWKEKTALQQPTYETEIDSTLEKLNNMPPLVSVGEIEKLKKEIKKVQDRNMFLLLGGDCAERFLDCNSKCIGSKVKILLQMSLIISWGSKIPTLRISRMAGQYAKPRSLNEENISGRIVKCYRGDLVNDFDPDKREHDPNRLILGYYHSAATINHIRACLNGGMGDLHRSLNWTVPFINDTKRHEYEAVAQPLMEALKFMDACGVTDAHSSSTADIYTSHEALLLEYEAAMTRQVNGKWYDFSAHFLWVGERTRNLDQAHIEFLRGVENPVGIKIGPTGEPSEIVELVHTLNPENKKGKIVLITRLGAGKVDSKLESLIEAVSNENLNVVWQCDPMHGNTMVTKAGIKTRHFDNILSEFTQTWKKHKSVGSHLGGVHFELTGDDVTECVGGPLELAEDDLHRQYTSYCDPRLNYSQAMDMAFRIADLLKS
eukprot:GHVL01015698.1.p1 GENE.GHVL01015698.1~~GHVL01015698.1.p1  ORF type:complete len:447 (+),score=59.83 GHVL01015698.1:59-1399(+)